MNFPSLLEVSNISVLNSPTLEEIRLGNVTSLRRMAVNATQAGADLLDYDLPIVPGVRRIIELTLIFPISQLQDKFPQLTSVHDLTLRDPITTVLSSTRINGTLTVHSYIDARNQFGDGYISTIDATAINSVGRDVNITSNLRLKMYFSPLTIDGNLSIVNNTNSFFDLDELRAARNISILDNPGTTLLPFLASLERAESIHLRGMMDT